jgi:DNA-binding HxlR family transcriptional regulator
MAHHDNSDLFELLQMLEARFALRVIWALKDGHPQTFRLLQDSVGGVTPNTLNARTKELRAKGLLAHGKSGYFLTPTGMDLAATFQDLQGFAQKWASMPNIMQVPKPAEPLLAAA